MVEGSGSVVQWKVVGGGRRYSVFGRLCWTWYVFLAFSDTGQEIVDSSTDFFLVSLKHRITMQNNACKSFPVWCLVECKVQAKITHIINETVIEEFFG